MLEKSTVASRLMGTLSLVLHHVAIIFPRRLQPAKSMDDLHPTAYLDALRGYAAWIVYNFHVFSGFLPRTFPARLFFSGVAMVDLFFVISGFALSYSLVGAMHRAASSRNYNTVLANLPGSVFRRYIRLYLPTTFASLVAFLVLVSGIGYIPTGPRLKPTFWENLQIFVVDTVKQSDPFAHVSGWILPAMSPYWLGQLWTIPVEFRGSMVVFMFCAMVCKMRPWARTTSMFLGMAAAMWWQSTYGTLFLGGMWLADQRHYRAAQEASRVSLPITTMPIPVVTESAPLATDYEEEKYDDDDDDTARSSSEDTTLFDLEAEEEGKEGYEPHLQRPSLWNRCTAHLCHFTHHTPIISSPTLHRLVAETPFIILFLCSLWIMGGLSLWANGGFAICTPNDPFPFNWLYYTMPRNYPVFGLAHWHLVPGALMNVYALEHSTLLRRSLLSSFSQYLGEMSFGIYAMHITVRWIVWDRAFIPWQMAYFGANAEKWYAFIPGYLAMSILVLWAAELFRYVDVWCVKFSKKAMDWVFVRGAS